MKFFAYACNPKISATAFLVVVVFVFFFLLVAVSGQVTDIFSGQVTDVLFWTSNRHAFLVMLANYCDSVVKFHVCEDDISCAFVNMWNLALQPQKTVYPQYHNAYDHQTWQGGDM